MIIQRTVLCPIAMLASLLLSIAPMSAQRTEVLKQRKLSRWDVPAANYSGITHVGRDVYAVVSDKPRTDGTDGVFYFAIRQDTLTGKIRKVEELDVEGATIRAGLADPEWAYDYIPPVRHKNSPSPFGTSMVGKDPEGICFYPAHQTLFVSDEADQRIREYTLEGNETGHSLSVPRCFSRDSIRGNRGFEALCYDSLRRCFWTTTENPLRSDSALTLRLQRFTESLQPAAQYIYKMDAPTLSPADVRHYAHGVSSLCALADGRLIVLERELCVPKNFFGARCRVKLYAINPVRTGCIVVKDLLCDFTTRLRLTRTAFANYEGICPGIRLADGRQSLLLIADSQGGAGKGIYHLRDYLRVVNIQ